MSGLPLFRECSFRAFILFVLLFSQELLSQLLQRLHFLIRANQCLPTRLHFLLRLLDVVIQDMHINFESSGEVTSSRCGFDIHHVRLSDFAELQKLLVPLSGCAGLLIDEHSFFRQRRRERIPALQSRVTTKVQHLFEREFGHMSLCVEGK